MTYIALFFSQALWYVKAISNATWYKVHGSWCHCFFLSLLRPTLLRKYVGGVYLVLIIKSTGYGFIAGLITTLSRRFIDKLSRPRAQGMVIFLTLRCCVVTYAFHRSLLHRILSPFHYIHITLRYQALRYVIAISNAVCNKFQLSGTCRQDCHHTQVHRLGRLKPVTRQDK